MEWVNRMISKKICRGGGKGGTNSTGTKNGGTNSTGTKGGGTESTGARGGGTNSTGTKGGSGMEGTDTKGGEK